MVSCNRVGVEVTLGRCLNAIDMLLISDRKRGDPQSTGGR